ncbi:amino acid adenylation domain-containing protein [Actinoplanes philippinensis]|uniref:amino acid adenylation domain-containing protein n=1 Tax=Actinoplanes philippinensis TaxID=35752 RepID=UPI00340206DC
MAAQPALLSDIEARATRTPGSPALIGSDGTLTYRQLLDGSEQLAGALVRLGIRPGHRVAVVAHKTTLVVMSMLAVMRAGAAYVPLDPRAPMNRMLDLIDDAATPVVVVTAAQDRELAAHLRHTGAARVLDPRTVEPSEPTGLPATIPGSAIALCFYTSGSSGRPKGVQLTYDGIDAFQTGFNELSRMDSESRCLNVAALHFDVSLYDVLLPLRLGAVVHLGPPIPVADVILGLITEHRITHTSSVGSTMTMLADTSDDFRGFDLTSLRCLLTGAEVINPRTVQRWLAAAPQLTVINAYGPAEATCAVINHCISEREPDRTAHYPIGLPAPGTTIRFRTADGHIDDDGPGEILIAGRQLMAGYLHRPEEQERAFVTDGGVRHYRTGDWGSRRPDGVILFAGRHDDEVKIRGYRVNLNEVKRALETYPDVGAAVVAALPDGPYTLRLVCGVASAAVDRPVLRDRPIERLKRLDADYELALRRHLAAIVPGYMLPADCWALPVLPVLSSGKPDVDLVRAWLDAAAGEPR